MCLRYLENIFKKFQNLPAAHWLHLPDDVKFQIDDALSQFEAGDFQVHFLMSVAVTQSINHDNNLS